MLSRNSHVPKRSCPEVARSRSGYVPNWLCPELARSRTGWVPKRPAPGTSCPQVWTPTLIDRLRHLSVAITLSFYIYKSANALQSIYVFDKFTTSTIIRQKIITWSRIAGPASTGSRHLVGGIFSRNDGSLIARWQHTYVHKRGQLV